MRVQPRRQRVERRRVAGLPAEEAEAFALAAGNDQALLAVVHAKRPDRAPAVDLLHAEQTGRVRIPFVEPRRVDADIAERGQSRRRFHSVLSLTLFLMRVVQAASATTGLRNTPTPLISTSATSPGRMKSGGSRFQPTPPHVPDTITSPGSSGRMVEM